VLGVIQHYIEDQGKKKILKVWGRERYTEAWLYPVIWDKCRQLHATQVRYLCHNAYIRKNKCFLSGRGCIQGIEGLNHCLHLLLNNKYNKYNTMKHYLHCLIVLYPMDKSTSICWC